MPVFFSVYGSSKNTSLGVYARGGTADQTQINLDGAPIYNALHLFGFTSVVDANPIRHVDFKSGAFSARHGGRLAAFMDITTKEGNLRETHGELGMGAVSANLLAEGPIQEDESSHMISLRRSTLDQYMNRLNINDSSFPPTNAFYDLGTKINWTINEKNRTFLSLYGSRDWADRSVKESIPIFDEQNVIQGNAINNDHFSTSWRILLSTLRWQHVFSKAMFLSTHISVSDYNLNVSFNTLSEQQRNNRPQEFAQFDLKSKSGVFDLGIKNELDWFINKWLHVVLGQQVVFHRFDFTFDRRHNVNVSSDYQFSKRFLVSAKWVFYTGQATTIFSDQVLTLGALDPFDNTVSFVFTSGRRNNFRNSDYHRLDLNAVYDFGHRGKLNHKLTLGIYNVYKRANIFFVQPGSRQVFGRDGSIENVLVLEEVNLFPNIPTFSYSVRF